MRFYFDAKIQVQESDAVLTLAHSAAQAVAPSGYGSYVDGVRDVLVMLRERLVC